MVSSVDFVDPGAVDDGAPLGAAAFVPAAAAKRSETLELARALTFSIPGATWVIEVDLLGHHRVTLYFKGLDISIDAAELGG